MAAYFVNDDPQPNGDHEVHVSGCSHFPSRYTWVGEHDGCATAVAQANRSHAPANGCYWCCRPCHSG